MWHVSARSGVATLRTAIHLLTYLAKPNTCKNRKANTTLQYYTNITTQTDARKGKLSRHWSLTSAAEVHIYILQ